MRNEQLVISYPPCNPGTDKTEIVFYANPWKDSQPAGDLIVTDTNLARVCGLPEAGNTLVLPAGETAKTPESVLRILSAALDNGLARDSVFIGIGGGVICDMAAFAASIYMRGARLELVPTTLLAMVDASIGGKTACDFGGCKNMMGTFYPAARIHIYPSFVNSLSDAEYLSGLGEVLKTAMLYDARLFSLVKERKPDILRRESGTVHDMITACASAKARVVEEDLTEKGRRMELNLGHTFAHALESAAGFGSVSHGEAVAWGIGRALDLGVRLGVTSKDYRDETAGIIQDYGWISQPCHPALSSVSPETLLQYMKNDKKKRGGKVRFILQERQGVTVIREVPDEDVLAVLE